MKIKIIAISLILILLSLNTQNGYSSNTLSNTNTGTNYIIGKRLLEEHKWPEAEVLFKEILKEEPKSNLALTGLATALTESGRREEALDLLNSTITRVKGSQHRSLIKKVNALSTVFLTNKTFQTYQDGINFMSSKKYRYARDKFERALTEEPENIEVLLRLSQSLILDNEVDSAIKKLVFAEKLNPHQPEVQLWLGKAHFQKGQLGPAVGKLKSAYTGMRGSELAPLWFAESLYASGQISSAIRILENDVKDWPYHLTSLITLAKFRSQGSHSDSKSLWSARKELQVALSRLDQYQSSDSLAHEGSFYVDLRKAPGDLKAEIQKQLQSIESRLASNHN